MAYYRRRYRGFRLRRRPYTGYIRYVRRYRRRRYKNKKKYIIINI